jgi:hypothetical protein
MSLTACSNNKTESLEKSSVSSQENNTQVGENIESDTSSVDLPSQGDSVSNSAETTTYDKQLQLIADQAAVWMGDTESVAEPFFYAVTDLDQNGRLEIIQSSCQGTGLYTYTNLWEVDANGTELIPCLLSTAEGDSQPDIIADPDIVYYDETSDCYFYIFRDEIRNGAAEHYQSQIAFSLQDSVVTTTLLSQMSTIYTSGGENAVITYTDADGNTIDEDVYNMTAENTFAGFTAMEATIGWTDYTVSARLAELTEAEIMSLLETSWKVFSLT